MESRYNNKDFEQFVKQNADQYRMFPSEKVWKGIHNTLHTRRWIYSLGFSLLLLSAGVMTWLMMNSSRNHSSGASPIESLLSNNNIASIEFKTPVSFTALVPGINKNSFFATSSSNEQKEILIPVENKIENVNTVATPVQNNFPIVETVESTPLLLPDKEQKAQEQKPFEFNPVGLSLDNSPFVENSLKSEFSLAGENRNQEPLSIESVMNSYHRISPRHKVTVQFNFVPTISYRKLKENKAFINSSQAGSSPYGYMQLKDINSVVTHKPDMGLEIGFTAGYPLSSDFRITAGLQFNVNRYDIRAYSYSTETATIALSTDAGFNYVTPATNYRNFNGYKQDWLRNLYFSVSAPIGAELLLGGNQRAYLGIGATIAPTYIIGDQAYLLSTDYKNYAEVPSLMRKWNMNTSFETFAGYSTGHIKWKVGPQVRYQVLSSFSEKYPVKEHLFDFGLKVGIMLSK